VLYADNCWFQACYNDFQHMQVVECVLPSCFLEQIVSDVQLLCLSKGSTCKNINSNFILPKADKN
jgi:hypothetical protein